MIKEIKNNRLLIDFEKEFYNKTYNMTYIVGHETVNHYTSGDLLVWTDKQNVIEFYLARINDIFNTELPNQAIIKFLNDKYNKDNYTVKIIR